ncbi:sterol desaturase family protein [Sulfitobacter sp. S190]|uniref:sterol desaturase family protein n=1 Tax=Sulfitobacter sp. S190 TaxID=2867022 RepID=UPI0021A4D176|nr:sterol desaturase family protein [Sulfitobacter sp. S190]UWR21705.1 sterol desaturase family protein [Sulfitobacter sp. S190]
MEQIADFLMAMGAQAKVVATAPFDPKMRIFSLYLVTSALIALGVYLALRRRGEDRDGSFLRFLFPRRVWSKSSAWLDLRYFFFHRMTGHFVLLGLGTWATTLSYRWITGTSLMVSALDNPIPPLADLGAAVAFMLVAALVADFLGFFLHYLQHKSPLLWQFHKVHHSAEVMHPVSNFREHPIDNLVYIVVISFGYGAVMGGATWLFGFTPSMPTLLGVPLMNFLFNVSGYNLRHSHVWLRWPGRWSAIFPSPAHHHVHHSCHPDHIDKNFAFMFPFWDVLFGTYHMPEDDRDVKFGIGGENEGELNTVWELYAVPFRDAWLHLQGKYDWTNGTRTKGDAAAPETPDQTAVTPAE